MRWFRMYSEMLDDEKVQMLSPELFKTWVNLLCIAATRDGVLLPVDKLAFKLRVSIHEMQSRLEDLVLANLIDIRPDKRYEPHNWQKRQWKSDDSADRVRKHRDAKRPSNGDVTVTETKKKRPQSPETEADTESKLQLSEQGAAREVKSELGFNSSFKSGFGSRRGEETLLRQAEGFGLNVDELVALTNRNAKSKREGYFVTLCLNQLRPKLPSLDDQIIRDALNGKIEQIKEVHKLLVMSC